MPRVINAFEQYFDGEGFPLVEGYLKFTLPGTNLTDKDTFADNSEAIPNANPVLLDSEGRAPSIFGTGQYRVTLFDSDGQQIAQFDPVPSLSAASLNWTEWVATVSYEVNAIVLVGAAYYKSLINNNINNNPTASPTSWEKVGLVAFWNPLTTYKLNERVLSGAYEYISLTGSNVANTPETAYLAWGKVDVQEFSSAITYTIGDVVKKEGFLFTPTGTITGGDPTTNPFWRRLDKPVWLVKDSTFSPSTQITAQYIDADTALGSWSINLTLIHAMAQGAFITIHDYAGSFASNNLTVVDGFRDIAGASGDFICDIDNLTVTFTLDTTIGWKVM